jgi:hypothetical protein
MSSLSIMSIASSSAPGRNFLIEREGQMGNDSFQSWSDFTPGQTSSEGVPRILLMNEMGTGKSGESTGPEDLEELVNFRVTGKQWSLGEHLSDDAANAPHVHGQGICSTAKEDLRRAVPKSDHLVSEGADGWNESSRQTKVSQLQHTGGE